MVQTEIYFLNVNKVFSINESHEKRFTIIQINR